MIEVIVHPTGDRAEAETPEAAVYAAITLIDEARAAQYVPVKFTASFWVDGQVVRHVSQAVLWQAAAA